MAPEQNGLPARDTEPAPTTGITVLDVVWTDWGPAFGPRTSSEQSSARLGELLRALARQDGVWILVEPDSDILDNTRKKFRADGDDDPLLHPYRLFRDTYHDLPTTRARVSHRQPGADRWRTGAEAVVAADYVQAGLAACESVGRQAMLVGRQRLVIAQMNLFRVRVYADGAAAAMLFGVRPDPATPLHVCLDVRFRNHLTGYWMHATLAVTSLPPAGLANSPHADPDADVSHLLLAPDDAARWMRAVTDGLLPGFRRRLGRRFRIRRAVVFDDDEYRPPRLVAAHGGTLGPGTVTVPGHRGLIRQALQTPDPASLTVANGVVDGAVHVWRRFLSNRKVPSYLLIPAVNGRRAQEDEIRQASRRLINIETETASRLYDIASELQMLEHLVLTYGEVTRRASAFWDQLALELPTAAPRRPGRGRWSAPELYQEIQLLQQILIQGVSDLQELRTEADRLADKVELESAWLRDEFDRSITERVESPERSIRDAVCAAGYLDRTRRAARRTVALAGRIAETYTVLLAAISSSFDERRARETDRFQQFGIVVAVAIAAVGFVTESFGLVVEQAVGTAPGRGVVLAICTAVATGGLWLLIRRGIGSIRRLVIGGAFELAYAALRAYLDRTRTERLDQLRQQDIHQEKEALTAEQLDALRNAQGAERTKRDREFVEDLVAVLERSTDAEAPTGRRHRSPGPPPTPVYRRDVSEPPRVQADPRTFRLALERWAYASLLASERPRRFWRYGLVRLTFFYAFFPFQPDADGAAVPLLVSRPDFERLLRNWCDITDPNQIRVVMDWGASRTRRALAGTMSPGEFAAELDEIGVDGNLDAEHRDVMLARMRSAT